MIVYIGRYRNHISTYHLIPDKWAGNPIVEGMVGFLQVVINVCINSWYTKLNRFSVIRISNEDTWSIEHTIAPIVLRLLEQFRYTAIGAPHVENEDVPEELWAPEPTGPGGDDENWFRRWEWVIGEMIFAFELSADGDNWEEIYSISKEEYEATRKRKENGFRLFGKYLSNLVD